MGTSSAWTPERRLRQREAIRRWRPWVHSTGPRSDTGKDRSSRNAERGAALSKLDAMLTQAGMLADLMEYIALSRGSRPLSGKNIAVDRKRLTRLRRSLAERGALEPSFLGQFMPIDRTVNDGEQQS